MVRNTIIIPHKCCLWKQHVQSVDDTSWNCTHKRNMSVFVYFRRCIKLDALKHYLKRWFDVEKSVIQLVMFSLDRVKMYFIYSSCIAETLACSYNHWNQCKFDMQRCDQMDENLSLSNDESNFVSNTDVKEIKEKKINKKKRLWHFPIFRRVGFILEHWLPITNCNGNLFLNLFLFQEMM